MSTDRKRLVAGILGSALLFPVGALADTSKCRQAIISGERTDLERFATEFPEGSLKWRRGSKEEHDAKVETAFRSAVNRTGINANRIIVSFSGLLRAFQYSRDTGVLTVNALNGVSRRSVVGFDVDYPYPEVFVPIRVRETSSPDSPIRADELSLGLLNVKNTSALWNRSQTLHLENWPGDGSGTGFDSLKYLIVGHFQAPYVMQDETGPVPTAGDTIRRRYDGTAMMLNAECIALFSERTKQILYEQAF